MHEMIYRQPFFPGDLFALQKHTPLNIAYLA